LLSDNELEQQTPVPRTIRASGLTTYFQPIFSIRQKAVVGMEALSRGVHADGSLITAANLFKMAAEGGLAQVIENLCRQTAIRKFARMDGRPDGMLLFLNLDLAAERDLASVPANLESLLADAGLAPTNVAVEFLEARLDDVGRFTALAASLRARGFLVVLDDVGAGHSNLDRIHLFRPDIIKIDRGLIAGVDKDYYKQETLKSLVGLSRRIGALVVAEGIETEEEAITALEIGADLLQGFFLARPHPVTSFADGGITRASMRTEGLARQFKSHMVDTINQRKLERRQHSAMLSRILDDLSRAEAPAFDKTLGRTVQAYSTVECVYILDDAGSQITETIWNGAPEQQPAGTLFHPAPLGTDHSFKEYCYVPLELELQKHTTEPYISLASGSLCRTISTSFRHPGSNRLYVLCVDVRP
jgi:EAL domain-containing protein (putative c-di-GMP-specific phosphodiesterase class I)